MNPDPRLNCCAALEEDHASYDRMARKVGIKYVMSMLNEGTLVWAKMAGYCRFVYYMYRVAFKGEIVSLKKDFILCLLHIKFHKYIYWTNSDFTSHCLK